MNRWWSCCQAQRLTKATIRKKPWPLGITEIQNINGEPTGIQVEITVCQKVKRVDFLDFLKFRLHYKYATEYGFLNEKAAYMYYSKYLEGFQYVGEEFCYAHKFEKVDR